MSLLFFSGAFYREELVVSRKSRIGHLSRWSNCESHFFCYFAHLDLDRGPIVNLGEVPVRRDGKVMRPNED